MRPRRIIFLAFRRAFPYSGPDPPPAHARAYRSSAHACVAVRGDLETASGVPPAHLVVERVPLHGDPAGGAHDAHELVDLLLGLGHRARGMEDLLADNGALHVVRPEVERNLGEREAHHD